MPLFQWTHFQLCQFFAKVSPPPQKKEEVYFRQNLPFWISEFVWLDLSFITSTLMLLCSMSIHIIFFFIFYFLYCSGFCHTLKWNSHGFTCFPHPDPPSHLPLHPIPLGLPSAPGLSLSHASNLGWWSVSPLFSRYSVTCVWFHSLKKEMFKKELYISSW